ncbi:MAG: energy-coupling factor transporter transmembrane protein EcfT [Bacilli bacterium]|jgi:energy-coupling factor transport system permease protein|nr:energy-coupling factor transporter transmembrane protein EcfT [Bacilli bacterium]
MFHNIMLGRYYPVRSKIHTMNPISKILCIFLFIFMAFLSTSWQLNFFLIILTFLFLQLTNIPIVHYFRTIKLLIPVFVVIFIIGIIFQIPLLDSFFLMIKFILILFYFTMLTLTTPMTEIIYGFGKLLGFLNLFGLNVSAIALFITETIQFVPNVVDEGSRILKSAASRGVDFHHSNMVTRLMILKSMSGQILSLSIKRIEDLRRAMILRLYQSGRRTNFRMNRWKAFDSYMVMMYLLALLVVIKKEILG